MFIDDNKLFEEFKIVFKNKDVKSIFIQSWNLMYSSTDEEYKKLNYSFESEYDYFDFIYNITNKDTYSSNETFRTCVDDIHVCVHKWSDNNYWVTLIKE